MRQGTSSASSAQPRATRPEGRPGLTLAWPACLAAAIVFVTFESDASFGMARPDVAAAGVLLLGGAGLALLGRSPPGRPAALPLHDPPAVLQVDLSAREAGRSTHEKPGNEQSFALFPLLSRTRILITLLATCLFIRAKATHFMLNNVQCLGPDLTALVPLLLVALDVLSWTFSRPGSWRLRCQKGFLLTGPWQRLPPCILLSLAIVCGASYTRRPPSTFICSQSGSVRWQAPSLQLVATGLDTVILFCVAALANTDSGSTQLARPSLALGQASIIAGLVLIICGKFNIWSALPARHHWQYLPRQYVFDLVKLIVSSSVTGISFSLGVFKTGPYIIMAITSVVGISASMAQYCWSETIMTEDQSLLKAFLALALASSGLVWFLRTSSTLSLTDRANKTIVRALLAWMIAMPLMLHAFRKAEIERSVTRHPIDDLISAAKVSQEAWAAQAATSKSLQQAAQTYRNRYGRHPPPHFDKWWQFSLQYSPAVLDTFDTLEEDLKPFWSLSPRELRERTWEAISNPSNMIGGIFIRQGQLSTSENTPVTHRWMLESIAGMLQPFVRWLPDMDLAINLNDEPRVMVPFEELEAIQKAAQKSFGQLLVANWTRFSANTERGWEEISLEAANDTRFREASFSPSFYTFGTLACPPGSAARTRRNWQWHRHCSACVSPHTTYGFISNWTQSGNVCHQPDLADLHGFFLTPSTLQTSTDLMPVFSQSKAAGFLDILYPSPWNYEQLSRYQPTNDLPEHDFADKDSTLFWRGSTTEGFAAAWGLWRGMARQRMVHLFNNPPQRLLMYLPRAKWLSVRFQHRRVAARTLLQNVSVDAHFVEKVDRCMHSDCDEQVTEFAPQRVPAVDFQAQWRFKYLLDTDGAGFSGRFIPFLQSKSLPFKTALFREWCSERLTAWVHFVPVDLRFQEIWSILAYFTGWQDPRSRSGQGLASHQQEAESIALQGREWANRVLRREDMEIYFFRLLLEWGRLTDDRREQMGYDDDDETSNELILTA